MAKSSKATKTVLLISSGYHLYREYLLRMIAQYARVWLLLDRDVQWERPYVVGSTRVDTLDVSAMVAAARGLPDDVVLDGVICWDEIRVVHAAQVAEELGLPGGPALAVARCRDKHQTRLALAEAGVAQARSVPVSSFTEATSAADTIGYPVIVKPRALGASLGVSLVNRSGDLAAAYAHARNAHEDGVPYFDSGVLVEEYMDGPEISVDSAIAHGALTPMFLARKVTGYYPHFEEVGHVVDSADPLLCEPRVLEVLQASHRAVGYRTGITHTELRLTATGPKIVEINARLGGDMIPYVGWVASGIDPGRVAVAIACGEAPAIESNACGVAAIRFFYPKCDATVESVSVDNRLLPRAVDVALPLASPGQRLVLPPNDHVSCRYGYAVVHGDTAEACDEAAQAAEQAFELIVRPAAVVLAGWGHRTL